MKKPQFDISIAKDGSVKIKVSGVSGQECVRLTDMLAQMIGREDSRSLTSEYLGGGGDVRINSTVDAHIREG
ncbi:MAG: DUF2997 domain-containing protein [Phycisphaeraceae bacterium]|nr:DUF2997 domain-containing protein [Phycisphaeraceae bacterium]